MADNNGQRSIDRVSINRPLTMHALTGEAVRVDAGQLLLRRDDDGPPSCELTLAMRRDDYEAALQLGSLHLDEDAGRAAEMNFSAAAPVELRLALRRRLLDRLLERGHGIEDLLRGLVAEDVTGELQAMRQSESWLALEAKQPVPLPGELRQEGALKAGFRTVWVERLAQSRAEGTAGGAGVGEDGVDDAPLAAQAEAYLSLQGWAYERYDGQIIRLRFKRQNDSWTALLRTEEDRRLMLVYSVFPVKVPEPQRAQLALELMNESYDMPLGAFDMDSSDGELRFRTTHNAGPGLIDPDRLNELFEEHFRVMDHFLPQLRERIGGG